MIKISVVSYNNEVPAAAPSAIFGREGKTLGRSRDNYLVLEDPRNLLSRTQAFIRSDGARSVITNLSRACPMLLNGRELDPDREYDLNPGDAIEVGLYVLRVEAVIEQAQAISGDCLCAVQQPLPESAIELSDASAIEPGSAAVHASAVTVMPQPFLAPVAAAAAAVAPPAVEPEPVCNADQQALIQAFLKGAGIPSVIPSQGLTPEFMETVGRLLAISVQGAIDLNALRALVKREVNVEVTQVVVRNNNPLKFLPDSETVLTQMFRKKMPGFMSPTEAMEDAYEDLRAHQRGVVAGMRAAMADIVKRINPERLEGKVKDQSFLDAMRPANRKARLWDLYLELFEKLSAEAQDDFQALFGQAFVDAYEQEVERVKSHAQQS